MAELLNILNWLLPLIYAAVLIEYGIAFFLRVKTTGRNYWLLPAVALHAAFLVLLGVSAGRAIPVTNYEVLSVLALATAVVYGVVEFAVKDRRTGVFVFIAVFLFQYTSSVFLPRAGWGLAAGGAAHYERAPLHILPATVAYTGFTIAAIYGLLYLAVRRNLKQHRIGVFFDRLPSLEMLGKMSWHAMLLGFAFITLSVLSGAIMLSKGPAVHPAHWEPKIVSKILAGSAAWVIYAIAVAGKCLGRWPMARLACVAVYGLVIVISMLIASIALS